MHILHVFLLLSFTVFAAGGFICPTPEGSFRQPYSCKSFIICRNSIPTEQVCPKDLIFHQKYGKCVKQERTAACSEEATESQLRGNRRLKRGLSVPHVQKQEPEHNVFMDNKYHIDAPPDCPTDFSGTFPHLKLCDHYYRCDTGKPKLLKCAPKLLYNQKTSECDWSRNVDCRPDGEGSVPKVPFSGMSGKSASEQSEFVCPQPNGVFSHSAQCEDYITCVNGEAFKYKCPTGQLFNPVISGCDLKMNVNCEPKGGSMAEWRTSSSSNLIGPSSASNVHIPRFRKLPNFDGVWVTYRPLRDRRQINVEEK